MSAPANRAKAPRSAKRAYEGAENGVISENYS